MTDGGAKPTPSLPDQGPERYATRRVTFTHPFTLDDPPEAHPAGSYEIETMERALESNVRTAHARTSTVLIIPTETGIRCREVSGSELDLALTRDAQSGPSENPDRGQADAIDSARTKSASTINRE